MDYEKELRMLIGNLLKEKMTATDLIILCPECQGWMEFIPTSWLCLKRGCKKQIPEKDLPGPQEISCLISEVRHEDKTRNIKDIIREIIEKK